MAASQLVARLLAGLASSGPVIDVRIGTHWTAVVVDTERGIRAGLAATQMTHDLEHGHPAVREAGKLIGRDARVLAESGPVRQSHRAQHRLCRAECPDRGG